MLLSVALLYGILKLQKVIKSYVQNKNLDLSPNSDIFHDKVGFNWSAHTNYLFPMQIFLIISINRISSIAKDGPLSRFKKEEIFG